MRLDILEKVLLSGMSDDLVSFRKLSDRGIKLAGAAVQLASIRLNRTSVSEFDTKDTSAVIRRMLVMQTKISLGHHQFLVKS